jgi:hypothetical protein
MVDRMVGDGMDWDELMRAWVVVGWDMYYRNRDMMC